MSKRAKIVVSVVVLVVIAGVAVAAFLKSQGAGPQVETATAATKQLAVTVTASGKVKSGAKADVFPKSPGALDIIYVRDGQKVRAGARIAQLDTVALEMQVAQARTGLAAAKAQLENAGASGGSAADIKAAAAQVAAAESGLGAARAAEAAAKSGWENAKRAFDAASAALPSGSPTLTALATAQEQAYVGYRQAQAGTAQARAGLDGAKAQLKRAQATDPASQQEAAEEGVRQASAALAAAEQALDDATLVAPIDGVVIFNAPAAALGGGAPPTEGSAVSPQAAPFTVVDFDALVFTAEVDEADIDRVKPGMTVRITLDAFPGEQFPTTVLRINPAAQPTPTGGTVFEVECDLTATGKNVLLGMKGDAAIEVSSSGSALTIPVEALFSEGGTDFVYVVQSGRLKKTEITVGATTDTEIEVLEGLSEGDVVALSGSTQYTDGMAVRVKE